MSSWSPGISARSKGIARDAGGIGGSVRVRNLVCVVVYVYALHVDCCCNPKP